MMSFKKVVFGSLVLAAITLFGFIKDDGDLLKKIATQLGVLESSHPQEKVHLHLDKPYYAIGDHIWFKAYVTIGGKHQLSALSGIVYVELINERDSIKQSLKLPLTAGVAWGDFNLTDSLREGNYRIRAYTRWMRNSGDEYFFDKTIHIGNAISNAVFTQVDYRFSQQNNQQAVETDIHFTDLNGKSYAQKEVSYDVQLDFRSIAKGKGVTDDKGNISISFVNTQPFLLKSGRIITSLKLADKEVVNKTFPVKATSDKADVQFFPESGELVSGIRSKIGFKATGADGLGVAVKGVVLDSDNKAIISFDTQHLGMGAFLLLPEKDKIYHAKITYPDGSENVVKLPDTKAIGTVLTINNGADNVHIKLSLNPTYLSENKDQIINVVGQSGGVIYYAAKTKLESLQFATQIPASRFPSGIVQFTVFSAAGEPLNERLIFIRNSDQLKVRLTTEKNTFNVREKVKMNLSAKDPDGKPVVGSFSVAVIDETKVPVDESSENTIFSDLLLTSDLKGYIEKPNYYFADSSDSRRADLDVLMLSQGYRRFSWKQILTNQFPGIAYPVEKVMEISGRIKTNGGKPVANGKVMLFSTAGGAFMLDTLSDAEGRFRFTDLYFADSTKFVIQARTDKNKRNIEVELDNTLAQLVTKNKNAADLAVNINNDAMRGYLKNSKNQYDDLLKNGQINRTIKLKEVTISEKKDAVKYSSNLNGAGSADQIIKSDQLLSCSNLSMCLQGRLMGVIFRSGIPYSTRSMNTPMQLVVDGMSMEANFLDQISPSDVETIEVLRSVSNTAIYGMRGAGGVLVITTKRGEPNYAFRKYAPGIIAYSPQGFYIAKEFYAPKYDDLKINAKVADLRTTIYWNPNVVTDKEGKTSFEFYNADGKGTYRAVVEGMDMKGHIGREIFRFQVK
ncbi:MAG: TonB-dependent receptor plug domain-containing protein [Sphingobacteriaceae bacterium]